MYVHISAIFYAVSPACLWSRCKWKIPHASLCHSVFSRHVRFLRWACARVAPRGVPSLSCPSPAGGFTTIHKPFSQGCAFGLFPEVALIIMPVSTFLHRSSFVTFPKIVYLGLESPGYRTHASLTFLQNDKSILQDGCTNLWAHPQRVPVYSAALMSRPLLNFGQPGECVMAVPCDCSVHFSDYQWGWTVFLKHDDDFYFLLWDAHSYLLPDFPLGLSAFLSYFRF